MEDVEAFLVPTNLNTHDPFLMKNMDEAVDLIHEVVEGKYKDILLKVDPDVDGFTSSAALYIFLMECTAAKRNGVKIYPVFSSGKIHGLDFRDFADQVPDHFDLVIVPDAGSDEKSFETYRGLGKPVLVLDHHPVESEVPENCIMVNCTDGEYQNPTLTGAGVVEKLIEAYDDCCRDATYPLYWVSQLSQLVALGLIADVADLRNVESRYYAYCGIEEMKYEEIVTDPSWDKSLMTHILLNNPYAVKHGPTLMSVAWYVAPLLNALIRVGDLEDKQDLFKALVCDSERVPYKPRRKSKNDPMPEVQMITRQEDMARRCRNIKSRQDGLVRDAFKKYKDSVTDKQIREDTAIVVCRSSDDNTPRSLTGLIAAKLTNEFKRPALLLSTHKGVARGSGRGFERGGISDFKTLLGSTNVCNMLAGHGNAFGIEVDEERVTELIKAINEAVPIDTLEIVEIVDYKVDGSKLTPEMVQEVGKLYELWGNHVEEPKFYINNICISSSDVEQYNDGSTICFTYNGVRYVKKYCARTAYDEFTRHRSVGIGPKNSQMMVEVIGTFQTEEYEGESKPYVKVLEFSSKPAELGVDFF